MQINLENLIPITEINQNFSKVDRTVDEVANDILSRHLDAFKELAK